MSLDRSLHLLFDSCTADPLCARTFANLQGDFSSVVAQLNTMPITVRAYNSYSRKNFTSLVTGDRFVVLVHDLLYSRSAIGRIPALIAQVRAGNADLLTTLVGLDASSPAGSDGISYSVRCNEYVPFADRQRTMDAAQTLLPEVRDHYVSLLVSIFDICAGWPTHPVDPRDHAAVTSDIPTLVMESENDPTTPPDFGRQAAATLSHSFFIETPGIGHSVIANGGDCGLHLAIAFLNDPQTMPDTTCTSQLGVVFFAAGA